MSLPDRPILVVEDDEDLAASVAEALELHGYRVIVSGNGQEALAAIPAERPLLILLDLMMPVMNGWQFLHERAHKPNLATVPVVIVTADGHAAEKAQALQVAGYLGKPVSLEALAAEVERTREPTAAVPAEPP